MFRFGEGAHARTRRGCGRVSNVLQAVPLTVRALVRAHRRRSLGAGAGEQVKALPNQWLKTKNCQVRIEYMYNVENGILSSCRFSSQSQLLVWEKCCSEIAEPRHVVGPSVGIPQPGHNTPPLFRLTLHLESEPASGEAADFILISRKFSRLWATHGEADK